MEKLRNVNEMIAKAMNEVEVEYAVVSAAQVNGGYPNNTEITLDKRYDEVIACIKREDADDEGLDLIRVDLREGYKFGSSEWGVEYFDDVDEAIAAIKEDIIDEDYVPVIFENIEIDLEADKVIIGEIGARLDALNNRYDALEEGLAKTRMECEWLIKVAEANIERAKNYEWDYSIFE